MAARNSDGWLLESLVRGRWQRRVVDGGGMTRHVSTNLGALYVIRPSLDHRLRF